MAPSDEAPTDHNMLRASRVRSPLDMGLGSRLPIHAARGSIKSGLKTANQRMPKAEPPKLRDWVR